MDNFNRKILIIGIDGGTWDILDEVINNGYMPYVRKLKEEGGSGIIKSTIPPISPSAWATIQTGIDAINNHIYEFYIFNKNSRKIEIVNSSLLENTIWKILSNVGKKVGVVNIPMTFPPKKINGCIISGILTPSIDSDFTYPLNLKEKILEKFPNYQLKYIEEKKYGIPIFNTKKFVQNRIQNIKDRTNACIYLINNYKLDLLMVNFQANDVLQHSLWGFMDKGHKLYNEKIKHYIFEKFYKTLDLCIETLREDFRRNTPGQLLTIILSDHGFESHKKQFYLGDWLYQNGFLQIKPKIRKLNLRTKIKEIFLKFKANSLQINLLKKFKNLEMKIIKKDIVERENKFLQEIIDWNKSYVLSMGISLYGHLFILKDNKLKERLIEILIKKLNQLEDPENGLKIVEKIYKKEELYEGDQPDLLPDLIVKPIKGYSFFGMYKGKKRLLEKISEKESEAIGKHSEKGIIIMHGTSVKNKKIEKANLKDIVPTVLNFFKIPISKDLKGNVLN